MTSVIVGLVALVVGVAAGFLIRSSMARSGARTVEAQAHRSLTNAQQEADQIRRESEQVRVQAEQEDGDGGRARYQAAGHAEQVGLASHVVIRAEGWGDAVDGPAAREA